MIFESGNFKIFEPVVDWIEEKFCLRVWRAFNFKIKKNIKTMVFNFRNKKKKKSEQNKIERRHYFCD